MKLKYYSLILFLLLASINIWAQNVVRGPYLQTGTPTSIIVKWRTDVATSSRVWYGTNPNALTNSAGFSFGSNTDHEVQLNGLNSNQKYYYAVADANGFLTTAGEDYAFKTAPTTGTTQPFRAWILGDCGTGHDDARAVRDAYYGYVGNEHTDAVLMLGDNAYREGTDAQYQNAVFDNMYEDILQKSVLWSCPGNHEYYTAGATPYYDIFTFPTAGQAGGLASGTEAYYSFDYGNIHFISMDSHNTPKNPGDPMLVWLQNDLNFTSQDWIVVIFHHPPYTKGSHDSDNLNDSAGYMRDMRENVLPMLESAGVDLVLSGHSHSYERSHLVKGHYGFSNTLTQSMILDDGGGKINENGAYDKKVTGATAGDGAVYITAGASGKVTGGSLDHPVMYYSLNRLGAISLEICDNQLDLKYINDYGVIDDYFSIVKDDYINTPPTVNITSPSNLEYFPTAQNITITASANDPDGSIQQVEFLVENVVVGVDTTPPFETNWTIPNSGEYNLYARATDNSGNKVTDQITIQVDTLCSCSIISDDYDDAEQNLSSGNVTLINSDLELGYDSNFQIFGMRFRKLNIPQGATIEGANIQFTVDETTNNNPVSFNIYGEDTNNAQAYSSANNNIDGRPKTSATVTWSPPNWTTVFDQGPAQLTPDLSPILQEIVDRGGYTESSAIALMVNGTGRRIAESYNGEEEYSPKLCVKYRLCAPINTPCDDGDPLTSNDVEDGNCNCAGEIVEGCTDVTACNYDAIATVDDGSCNPVDCAGNCTGTNTGPGVTGAACDDGNPTTVNEVYDGNCNCVGTSIPGCIDATACNYDATATVDDGSCVPSDCAGNCTGNNTGPATVGTACNDNDATTINDTYDSNCNCVGTSIPGCTDATACNYDATATVDDGSCNLPDCLGNCNGTNSGPITPGTACDDNDPITVNDLYDGNCNCTGAIIEGCMDATACNYDATATVDNGNCNPVDCLGNCNGSNTGTALIGTLCNDNDPTTGNDVYDANCNCAGVAIPGCTDATACNYSASATIDDGSCTFCYCDITATNASYEWIAQMTFNTINNTTGTDGGYGDYTNLSTDVYTTQTYSITLSPDFAGQAYGELWIVYIDWNQNYIFEASEIVYQPASTNTTIIGNITIPANATLGNTTMRVIMSWDGNTSQPNDACTTFQYGEVEDYSINVLSTVSGCTDATACNYDATVTIDDGSCNPVDCIGNCNGTNTGPAIAGTACNDNDPTTVNDVYDGNCTCTGTIIQGCMDATACNYDATATIDDGSCNPVDCIGNCNGTNTGPAIAGTACNDNDATTVNDVYDGNCTCTGTIIQGCMDATACNYDATATIDDGSCNPVDCAGNCNGTNTGTAIAGTACNDNDPTTVNDVYDGNCTCTGTIIQGCTDATACNYDATATIDDGSCNPVDCAGNCNGTNTGPAIAGTACNDNDPTTVNDVYDGNCNCGGAMIAGCTDANACNYNANAAIDDGSCNPVDCLGNCNGTNTGTATIGSSCNDGDSMTVNDTYNNNCDCVGSTLTIPGCTDPNACNYNATANVDNGSCNMPDCAGICNGFITGPTVAGSSCDDGDSTTIYDTYNNACECKGVVIPGCTDPTACNYNASASLDNGSCNPVDCEGNCSGSSTGPDVIGNSCNDGNNNTINDTYDSNCNCVGTLVVYGCTNPNACNYNASATDDNGTCNMPDCAGICTGFITGPNVAGSSCDDGDSTTIYDTYNNACECKGVVIPGCTDANACNYNPGASLDNGSCNMPDCAGNCNGTLSGTIDTGDACDDGNDCTLNDMYDANCNCIGTLIDNDNDGICDNQTTANLVVSALLSGAYEDSNGLMRDDLRTLNLIPNTDPYFGTYNLDTTLLTSLTGSNAIVDWVVVELRDAVSPATIVESKAALIQRDGDIIDATLGTTALAFNSNSDDYYVTIRHRNHLGGMTATPIDFTLGMQTIDFRQLQTPMWGNYAMQEKNNKYLLWPANTDVNQQVIFQGGNNDPNAIFFGVLTDPNNVNTFVNYIGTNYCYEDVNMDGRIIYQGGSNDANLIFFTVLIHPANTLNIPNFVIEEQLP